MDVDLRQLLGVGSRPASSSITAVSEVANFGGWELTWVMQLFDPPAGGNLELPEHLEAVHLPGAVDQIGHGARMVRDDAHQITGRERARAGCRDLGVLFGQPL